MKHFFAIIFCVLLAQGQQQGLGGTGGTGGTGGYQSSATVFQITTAALADAPANSAYSQTLSALNGTGSLTWTVAFGVLPHNLILNSSTGVISGTPDTVGVSSFTILVTDSSSPTAKTATRQFTISVTCPILQSASPNTLPPGNQGAVYNFQFGTTGGLTPISYSNPGGGIPPGTTLSTGGSLSGTPTAAGSYTFNVSMTDSCPTPQVVTQSFTVQINNALTITTGSLPNGTRGSPYSASMAASGGTPAYSWAVINGTLPAGLTLLPNGQITGIPTQAVTSTVTIQVTDSLGNQNSAPFTISISCTALAIATSPTLQPGTQGQPFSQQLQFTGGSGGVTWSLLNGALDPGLILAPNGLLSGVPTSPNTYSGTIQAQDSCSPTPQTAALVFSQTISQGLTITTNSLPGAVQGVPYTAPVSVQGGTPPYVFSVPSGPLSPGAFDMLDWDLMRSPDRNSFHMAGTVTPGGTSSATYSLLQGGLASNIKSTSGNPWDIRYYDSQFLYFWFTENNDAVDQAACQLAGFQSCFVDPFAYKQALNPRPAMPRYFAFGSPDVVIKLPAPNPRIRTTNCGTDNQPQSDLGNIVFVTHDAGTGVNYGGDVGNAHTITLSYYFGVNSLTAPYPGGQLEIFYFAYPYGRFKHEAYTWNGTTYTLQQTTNNNNRVAGGTPALNFGCKVPNLPQGGILPTGVPLVTGPSLDLKDSTGVISGTPNTSGASTFNIQVEDSVGTITQKQLSIVTTCPALSLTSTTLPQGTVNQPFNFSFAASGGAVPNSWHVIAGTLPNGMVLSPGGTLGGTPTQTGIFNITVQVTDSCNPQPQSAQKNFTLTIAANSGPLTITTGNTLPQATEAVFYSQQIQVTGGTPPYLFSVSAGALPSNITQSTSGLISGTPSQATTSTWTARVTDAIAGIATKSLSLTVVCPALSNASTSPLPVATVGQFYTFKFSSAGGILPITFTGTSIPAGLTLALDGTLSGTPTTAATSSLGITVHDSCSPSPQSATNSFSLTVNPAIAPLAITTASLPAAIEGVPYNTSLAATGGVPPYNFSIIAGHLPPGLNLSPAGAITGTPTSAESDSITFQVSDSALNTATKVISITVSCPSFSVSSTSPLQTATQGQPFSFQFVKVGGMGTVTWTGNNIPAGLSLSLTGLLSGTPTGTGTSTLNITATDSCAPTPQVVGPTGYSLTINPAPNPLQIITPPNLPTATRNQPYAATISATGGAPPYSNFTVTAGTLPTGISLNSATGALTGTPTVVQTASFTVRVSDSVAATASKAFTLQVVAANTADNRFCNTNEVSTIAGTFDGPAQQIQNCVRTALADTPAAGPTKTVCASGCDFTTITAASAAASPGWIIQVKATTGGVQNVFSSATISTSGTATNWIIYETDQIASLPPEGTRISPAFVGVPSLHVACPAGSGGGGIATECGRPPYTQPATPGIYLPKIRGGNNTMTLNANVHHVRFIGWEVTTTSGTDTTNTVLQNGPNDHIIYDRIYNHGGDSATGHSTTSNARGWFWSGCTYCAIVDSYGIDYHCKVGGSCTDAQVVLLGGNSAATEGPWKLTNDFLESASEPAFAGGGGVGAANSVPHDLEYRRNHSFHPLFWKANDPSFFGTTFSVKNLFELKTLDRVLMEGNIFEQTFEGQADQHGHTILLSAKNQASVFGGTAASNGAGTINKLTGGVGFNSNQISQLCAIPGHCNFKYNGIVYPVQTIVSSTVLTVGPNAGSGLLPPTTSSAAFQACQPGQNPNAQVTNITVRYSQLSHAKNAFQISGAKSDCGDSPHSTGNISIHDVTVDDMDGAVWISAPGARSGNQSLALGQITNGLPAPNNLHDITVRKVTGLSRLSSGSPAGAFGPGIAFIDQTQAGVSIPNLKIYDNIFAASLQLDQLGICPYLNRNVSATLALNCVGAISGTGPASYCFDHNVLATTTATTGASTAVPSNPPYPTTSPNCAFTVSGNPLAASYNAIQFTNLNGALGGNYQLLPTSPYHNTASDGTDPGATWSLVQQAIAGVN